MCGGCSPPLPARMSVQGRTKLGAKEQTLQEKFGLGGIGSGLNSAFAKLDDKVGIGKAMQKVRQGPWRRSGGLPNASTRALLFVPIVCATRRC